MVSTAYVLLTLAIAPFFVFVALVTLAAMTRPSRRLEPLRTIEGEREHRPSRFRIVIPAHNEEPNIEATIASCLALDYDRDSYRVHVIADNCDDGTAETARAAGAEVFERADAQRRSKGYALEDFLNQLQELGQGESESDEAIVVVDADTVVATDLLARFDAALTRGDDWIQSYYSVSNPDKSWRTRLLTYAFSLFNGVWLLGQDRLGLSVGFRGNGMCFSAQGLKRVPWKAYGLVEDQEFSWILRVAGERVRFLPETGVYGEMVSKGRDAVSQRRRWEEGRRSLIRKFLKPLLTSPALSPLEKALSAVELVFPPLTRLLLLLLLAVTVQVVASFVPGLEAAAIRLFPVHAAMALTLALYAVSPFFVLGLPWRYLSSLSAVPYFAAWKFYNTFHSRTQTWIRTPREVVPRHEAP